MGLWQMTNADISLVLTCDVNFVITSGNLVCMLNESIVLDCYKLSFLISSPSRPS